MKKIFLLSFCVLLLTHTALAKSPAASLNATGYEWLGYSAEDKKTFAELVYIVHGIDRNKHKPEDIINTLNDFYYGAIERAKADPLGVDHNDFLKVRCVEVITSTE